MIDPKTLTDADKGRKVIYQEPGDFEGAKREEGELSSWNDFYVFVRFKGPNGESCLPEDVTFALHRA